MKTMQRQLSLLAACLIAIGMLAAILLGLGWGRAAMAAPIQDDARGRWTDTFTDALGLTTTVNVVANVTQGRLELEPPAIISQTDWIGGAGLLTATAALTNRYSSGLRVNPLDTGNLSLGFTAPISDKITGLDQDGYPDLVFGNYAGGSLGNLDVDSYLYYGSASGFTETNRASFPISRTTANAIADLNNDGFLDIVFARAASTGPSYIYWGGIDGYSDANRTDLTSFSTTCATTTDLNGDGYLDIVLCNFYDNASNLSTNSYIYWGSADGYTVTYRAELPTVGAMSSFAADFNKDGYLDLSFSNYINSLDFALTSTFAISSYVYWGSANGYTVSNRAELPTIGAHRHSVADLNHDGFLDIVFSNRRTGGADNGVTSTYAISSYVYWGSSMGFSVTSRLELPTVGSYGNSLADLNGDNWPEIVFSNHYDGITHSINSYIYWNHSGTFSPTDRTELPASGAAGNCVGDLNLDGYPDIVFANRRLGNDHDIPSYIYWGSNDGYTITNRSILNTHGAVGCSIAGGTIAAANTAFGSVYGLPITGTTTITNVATTPHIYATDGVITSTGFDSGKAHTWQQVSWNTTIPVSTGIAIDVSTSGDGINWSTWSQAAATSISGTNSVPLNVADARFIRYRAVLTASTDHKQTPVLHDIQIKGGQKAGNATSVVIAPVALDRWDVITWTAQVAAGQVITIQVLDSNNNLIPDGVLPGNDTGFSLSPLNISGLSVTTYPSLTLQAWFASTNVTATPSLDDWSISWFVTPVSLTLTPADTTITAGQAISYTAIAHDGYGKSWDVTAGSQYTIAPAAGGAWASNAYTSEVAGDWTVTVTYQGTGLVTGTTGLTVQYAPAVAIDLTPVSATITSGDVITYLATARDSYSNSWDVTGSTMFTIEAGAGGSWVNNVYAAEKDGVWTVTGVDDSLTNTAVLTVANVAPTANAGGPYDGIEGSTILFNGSGSNDPGNDITIYGWDLNYNGVFSVTATGVAVSYTYADNGTYTAALRVTDDNGATGLATTTVTIANVAPTVATTGPYVGDEGSSITLTGIFTDPGTLDTHTFLWSFGDDSGSTLRTPAHTYADNGVYTAVFTTTDKDNGFGVTSTTITIANVAPTAVISAPLGAASGVLITFDGSLSSDPGNDALSFAWDFDNDGGFDDGSGVIVSRTFTSISTTTFVVRLRVDDGEGGQDIATHAIQVTPNVVYLPVVSK